VEPCRLRAGFPDPPSDFGVYAYDAANVLIAAARTALAAAAAVTPDVRRSITAGVQATDMDGASGRLSFDAFGEPRSKVLTIYRVVQGRWEPAKTAELH
jgi:branched-chain amino acid transport system substrate-binding protein